MASAETTTAAQPSPTATVDVSGELPFGWDKYGPYFLWGTLKCRIHLFKPWEWRHMWGTGPCWF
ncbi:hypothetical protein Tcur_1442 [Thermomonospora curvata DSM 43183]|uniref:Uncharacterized protein n=2 Tax=Thermomonosporaceae TaxID=2012 RepID=D1AAL1_THECD|nr:hypothetical protein Tcur_1442 [Thermomonospora curvata DSM 43183]